MTTTSVCNWNVSDSFILLAEEVEGGCCLRTASVCIDHSGCAILELSSIQARTIGCLLSECCFVV